MNVSEMSILPYTATSISVLGRCIFMFLLYKNKSTNTLSLTFCILNICSSGMWTYYSVKSDDLPMVVRSGFEIVLLLASALYIVRNKVVQRRVQAQVSPVTPAGGLKAAGVV
jgi:uncharacterized protein with PQ loop repeat